jgi:hypothetical protein
MRCPYSQNPLKSAHSIGNGQGCKCKKSLPAAAGFRIDDGEVAHRGGFKSNTYELSKKYFLSPPSGGEDRGEGVSLMGVCHTSLRYHPSSRPSPLGWKKEFLIRKQHAPAKNRD